MERKGLLHIVQERFYPHICSRLEVNFWSTKLCMKSHQPACLFLFFFNVFLTFVLFNPLSWRGLNVSLIPGFPRGKPSSSPQTPLAPTHSSHVSLQLLGFTHPTHPRTRGENRSGRWSWRNSGCKPNTPAREDFKANDRNFRLLQPHLMLRLRERV